MSSLGTLGFPVPQYVKRKKGVRRKKLSASVGVYEQVEPLSENKWLRVRVLDVTDPVTVVVLRGTKARVKRHKTDAFFLPCKLVEVLVSGLPAPVWVREDAVRRIECDESANEA